MVTDTTRDAFWKAIEAARYRTTSKLLHANQELTRERIVGEAWAPGRVRDPVTRELRAASPTFPFSNTALHVSVLAGRLEMARLLLDHGSELDAMGFAAETGLTPPVAFAAWQGSLEMLRLLLQRGADPNLPASVGSALYLAAEQQAEDKIELLETGGARHDVFSAAITGNAELVGIFLAAFPPLRLARSLKHGRTPRAEALHHGQFEVVRLIDSLTAGDGDDGEDSIATATIATGGRNHGNRGDIES